MAYCDSDDRCSNHVHVTFTLTDDVIFFPGDFTEVLKCIGHKFNSRQNLILSPNESEYTTVSDKFTVMKMVITEHN